jgi:hypothetical protein
MSVARGTLLRAFVKTWSEPAGVPNVRQSALCRREEWGRITASTTAAEPPLMFPIVYLQGEGPEFEAHREAEQRCQEQWEAERERKSP